MSSFKKSVAIIFLLWLVVTMSMVCLAADVITIDSVNFTPYTDGNGVEDDTLLTVEVTFSAPSGAEQVSLLLTGEDITEISEATKPKIIFMDQSVTPSDGVYKFSIEKDKIKSAAGVSEIEGATLFLKMGGKTVTEMATKEVTVTLPKINVLKGDVTLDGLVNSTDATQILRYNARLRTFTEAQILAGDVTGDGEIDIFDAVWVLRYSAGLIDE